MTQQRRSGEIARFVLPVVAENAFTALVSLVYSAITGALGPGSLAAANTGNQAMNVISALFAMISTGCAILTARLVGRKDTEGASRTAEHDRRDSGDAVPGHGGAAGRDRPDRPFRSHLLHAVSGWTSSGRRAVG